MPNVAAGNTGHIHVVQRI